MESGKTNPLVSVIIPVFNGSNYLPRAIRSVLDQTYQNIEIIVVDDGSTDQTWEIISNINTNVIGIHKENGGVASALNTGIDASHGKYIAWLSHDDEFLSDKISKQVEYLQTHPSFVLCYTDFEIIDANNRHIAYHQTPDKPVNSYTYHFLYDMYINGSTVLITREGLRSAGPFNVSLRHTQDLEMWIRLSAFGEFGRIAEPLVKFRSHPQQGSFNYEFQLTEEQDIFTKIFNQTNPLYLFPGLKKIKSKDQVLSKALTNFSIILIKKRKWYRFGLTNLQKANALSKSLPNSCWIIICKCSILVCGDEFESLGFGRRSRILLSIGNIEESRKYARQLLVKHPLRMDILAVLLLGYFPRNLFNSLKELKHRISHA
jgi:glycosyltransferase involved in cell wall biosynthesis